MKTPILLPILEQKNKHERDDFIQFQEEGHKYTITCDNESNYTSVTTFIHSHFSHFDPDDIITKMMRGKNWKEGHKYWGLTPKEIKELWNKNGDEASSAGTKLHFAIECFMNCDDFDISEATYNHSNLLENWNEKFHDCQDFPDDSQDFHDCQEKNECQEFDTYKSLEWKYFLRYVNDFPDFEPFRTEWLIFHEELKLAGSIDMVYRNQDDTLMIYDWKRSKGISEANPFCKFAETSCIKHLPDTNYWHYSLQLNIYKTILEEKYNKQITSLYLVRLHPDAEEDTYERIPVPNLSKEVKLLFQKRLEQVLKKETI
jgi:ATP-dependent exoDNAse (exonuclease V) beta subunit